MSNRIKILILFMLSMASCEKGFITKCDECQSELTGNVVLKIWLGAKGSEQSGYTVTIYEGPVDDGLILTRMYIPNTYYEYQAMPFKDYSFTAEYIIGGVKYIAVDEACPKIRYDESTCDDPCYYVYDNLVDLRLKYI